MTQVFDLKEFRLLNNLTQKQVADILGINQSAFISAVERGERSLSESKLAILTDEKNGYVLPEGYVVKSADYGRLNPLTAFRKINGLTQDEIADYLGIKRPYVSLLETGRAALNQDKVQRLIDNDRGWNADNLKNMINSNNTNVTIGDRLNHSIKGNNNVMGCDNTAALKKEIEYLKKLLDEKERTIQTLTNILTNK